MSEEKETKKEHPAQYKKGHKGGPGRPKGSKDKQALLLDKMVRDITHVDDEFMLYLKNQLGKDRYEALVRIYGSEQEMYKHFKDSRWFQDYKDKDKIVESHKKSEVLPVKIKKSIPPVNLDEQLVKCMNIFGIPTTSEGRIIRAVQEASEKKTDE